MDINSDYVRGFADADGGFTGHIVTLSNTDLELLGKIASFLDGLGIEYYITYIRPKGYKKMGKIQITGLRNLLLYASEIGFCMTRKQRALEERIKHLCRKGRPYNADDYELYLELKSQGTSYRAMAKALGLSPAAIDRREKRGIYPLDSELFAIAKRIVCKK